MLHERSVPVFLKILTYFIFFLFLLFQSTYVKAFDTAQNLSSNYTFVKKYSNPSDYNNNIIFISSRKPIYQSYLDPNFNIKFNAILIRKIIQYCVVKETRRDDGHREETHEWVKYKDYSDYNQDYTSTFKPYEKYFNFKIGNYMVISNTFNNIEPRSFIPTDFDIKSFSKSQASLKLTYLGDGYFFDRNFPDHRDLYTRLHNCRNQDTYIKFDVFNPQKVSVLGLLNNGNITHVDFFKYDFSVIYDDKISPNSFIAENVSKERIKMISSGIFIILILIILLFYYHRSYFSLMAISFLIITSTLIRAYYITKFPIKFKYMFLYSIFGLVVILLYFYRQISQIVDILLIS